MDRSYVYQLTDPQGNRMIGYCKEGRDPRPDLEKKRGLTDLEMEILDVFDIYEEHPEFIGKIMPRTTWYYYQTIDNEFELNIYTPGDSYARKDRYTHGEDILEVYKELIDKYKV